MGKDSLIKSTSKKKTTSKKVAGTKKTQKIKKAASKTSTKFTKKTGSPKASVTAKSQAPPKTEKAVASPPKKQVPIRELLAKKFEQWKPDKPFRLDNASQGKNLPDAPPIITATDPAEVSRLKSLLLKKYDYNMLIQAAAEKAAAEKAAAEKAAAETPPPRDVQTADPAEKMLKYGIAGFVVLLLLVIGASFLNTGRYYIRTVNGATEIWQGKFAPKGAKLLISLPGMSYAEPVDDVYTKDDVFPLIFNYYIEKADTLLDVPGLPDFEGVRSYLNQALLYGTTPALNQAAYNRLNTIDLMVLLYRADVAASKDTIEDLETALEYLQKASGYDMDALQMERIAQKKDATSKRLEALKTEAAAETKETEIKEAENPKP